jgi:hypothetical protein
MPLQQEAAGFRIVDAEGHGRALILFRACREAERWIEEELFKEPCELANKLHKSLTGARSKALALVVPHRQAIGRELDRWEAEAKRLEAEERKRLEAAAQAEEQARLETQARLADELGVRAEDVPESLVDENAPEIEVVDPIVLPTPQTATVAGVSGSEKGYAELDPDDGLAKLVRFLGERVAAGDRTFLPLLALNESKANQLARSLGENMNIPGLVYRSKTHRRVAR